MDGAIPTFVVNLLDSSATNPFFPIINNEIWIRYLAQPSHPTKCISKRCTASVKYECRLVLEGREDDRDTYVLKEVECNDNAKKFSFQLGTGSVIKAWDFVFTKLDEENLGEGLCLEILTSPNYAYGEEGSPPHIPPNAFLLFKINVLSLTNEKSIEEYIEECEKIKSEANQRFLTDPEAAAVLYMEIIDSLKYVTSTDPQKQNMILGMKLNCHLNRAASFLKIGEFKKAKESCDKALSIEPSNVKALYRRAKSFKGMGCFDRATNDIERAMEQDPKEPLLKNELNSLKLAETAYANNLKTIFKKMSGALK